MSDRLKIVTHLGRLSTEELCRIGIALNCHGLDRVWKEHLHSAYTLRNMPKMQEALRRSSKALALTYHQLLRPVEWDYWLALRAWTPEPLNENGEILLSARENSAGR